MTSAANVTPRDQAPRFQKICAIVAVIGAALCLIAALMQPEAFWSAYLVGLMFVLGIALGALGISLLNRLTGGRWGTAVAPELTASVKTIPVMIGLALLLGFGVPYVYDWTANAEAFSELAESQKVYLRVPFWIGRAIAYFCIWVLLAMFVTRGYRKAVQSRNLSVIYSRPRLAGLGLLAFWLTTTFAATDWMMALEPEWLSTIYGAMLTMAFVVSGQAFVIFMRPKLQNVSAMDPSGTLTHDLANLLLAFILLWVYFSFSQYLIIWSGDLPFEVIWYERRITGVWSVLGTLLLLFHFIVPLAVLLSRDIKRSPEKMAIVAAGLLLVRLIDFSWLILPAFPEAYAMWALYVPLTAITAGSVYMAAFFWNWHRSSTLELPSLIESDTSHRKTPATASSEVTT